ncbi:MAG: hypothetical protein AAGF84_03335 [Planctomycetota bacterium]
MKSTLLTLAAVTLLGCHAQQDPGTTDRYKTVDIVFEDRLTHGAINAIYEFALNELDAEPILAFNGSAFSDSHAWIEYGQSQPAVQLQPARTASHVIIVNVVLVPGIECVASFTLPSSTRLVYSARCWFADGDSNLKTEVWISEIQ